MSEVVLVCGGRDYRNAIMVNATLDALHAERRIVMVIEGGANGADALAHEWAVSNDVSLRTVFADWGRNGKAAGSMRNREMLKLNPTLVVAFPGGTGTADMVRRARAANVKVIEVAGFPVVSPPGEPTQEGATP